MNAVIQTYLNEKQISFLTIVVAKVGHDVVYKNARIWHLADYILSKGYYYKNSEQVADLNSIGEYYKETYLSSK